MENPAFIIGDFPIEPPIYWVFPIDIFICGGLSNAMVDYRRVSGFVTQWDSDSGQGRYLFPVTSFEANSKVEINFEGLRQVESSTW